MKTDTHVPMFVVVPSGQEIAVINLHQIAMIHDFRSEGAIFEMSNGKSITIHGGEAVARILGFIAHNTITLHGKSFPDLIEELCAAEPT